MKYILISLKRTRFDDQFFCFWRENNAGYTQNLNDAGIYTEIIKDYHNSDITLPVLVNSNTYNNLIKFEATNEWEDGEIYVLNNEYNRDILGVIIEKKDLKRK